MRDVFLILILLVSVSGCPNESSLQPKSEKVPKDLDIVYGYVELMPSGAGLKLG